MVEALYNIGITNKEGINYDSSLSRKDLSCNRIADIAKAITLFGRVIPIEVCIICNKGQTFVLDNEVLDILHLSTIIMINIISICKDRLILIFI